MPNTHQHAKLHAHVHAQTRIRERRQHLAFEAAKLMADSTPSDGDTTSSETLSVSSSTRSSSFFTGSPAALVHLAMVASVTDSPRVGVRISAMGRALSDQAKASVRKTFSSFRWRLIRPEAVEAEAGRPT